MDKLFTIIIVFSAVFFLYNKVRAWRTPESLLKQIYQTKATLSLGTFMTACGANLLLFQRGTVDIIVGIAFLLVGLFNVVYGVKAYRHYIPQLKD